MTLKKQFEQALREAEGQNLPEPTPLADVAKRLAAVALICSIASLLLAIAALVCG